MAQQVQRIDRPRSFSAKPTANRARPTSGFTNSTRVQKAILKTQLLQTIYQGRQKSPKRKSISKTLLMQGISTQDIIKTRKSSSKYITKSKQQVYEENILLKQQINKLNQQLALLRGKVLKSSKSKKAVERNKKLDIEFEKQIFWNGNKSHMISGIKHQYEKLKQQYAELNKQYNQLKINSLNSKAPQYKIYVEEVERQNKRLTQRLTKILQQQQNTLRGMQSNSKKQATQFMLLQSEQRAKGLKQKIHLLEQDIKKANANIKDKQKKIEFLQKLIIEKDNAQHHIGRKLKRFEREKQNVEHIYKEIQKKCYEKEKQLQIQINALKIHHDQQKSILQTKTKSILQQKDEQIKYLEGEIKDLENRVAKLRIMPTMALPNNSSINMMNSNMGIYKSNNDNSMIGKKSALNNSMMGKVKNSDKRDLSRSGMTDNIDCITEKNFNSQIQAWESKQDSGQEERKKPRTMQTADKKHSQESKRVRKVQFGQVQELGQLLKYRMIRYQIQPQQMRNYFCHKPSNEQNKETQYNFNQQEEEKKSEEDVWENQYISMAETQQILEHYPFNLQPDQAHILARYAIEDCQQEYLYCDLGNQNRRDIVKSIMKALIGDYQIPASESKAETKSFLDNYETNLESSLRTYYPNGKVGKKKFLDTINGLGVQISENAQEFILSYAVAESKSLQQLEYGVLFIPEAKIKAIGQFVL